MQYIDITGQKFGKLTVLERSENTRGDKQTYFKCMCECGNYFVVTRNSLVSGNTKSCGCLHKESMKKMTKDLSGNVYTKLLVLKRDDQISNGVWYICKCECGNIKSIRANSLKQGSTKSCGCLQKEVASSFALPNNGSAKNKLFYQYKNKARKKGYSFDLTFEDVLEFTKQNCFYCNREPQQIFKSKKSKYLYNGIDRKNNSIGYVKENCVSCCVTCNYAKGTRNYDAFILWIDRVSKNLKKEINNCF